MASKPAHRPAPAQPRKGALVSLVGATAAALLLPFVSGWESGGKQHLVAYRDIAGIWTICDGDTLGVRKGDVDTVEGCAIRLDKRLADHAGPVLKCVPTLRGRDAQLAASVSLAYNIGTAGFCGSTAARRFNAGEWRRGCDAMLAWNRAGGRVVQGLVNRRQAERKLCLTGLPAA